MTDADLLRRILGAMRPDIPLDWHDNAWLAAKGLDTLEAIEADAAGVTLAATPAPLAPHPGRNHEYRMTCLSCGEPGHLFVGFHSPGETFNWSESKSPKEPTDEPTGTVARGTHSRGLPEHSVPDVPSGSRPPRPPDPPKDREWDGS